MVVFARGSDPPQTLVWIQIWMDFTENAVFPSCWCIRCMRKEKNVMKYILRACFTITMAQVNVEMVN